MMPGDLIGIDLNNQVRVLGSFGMVSVELFTPAGQPLQLAEGQTARISMEVPGGLLINAPAVIPMWYFDEIAGVWREEGTGSLSGSQYVGEVRHFTFWNYDVPFELVEWQAEFIVADENPAADVLVCLTSDTYGTTRCERTNMSGQVSGPIPARERLEMTVLNSCNEVLHSEFIGPFESDSDIGRRELESAWVRTATLTGCVESCDGIPVPQALIVITHDGKTTYTRANESGCFTRPVITCETEHVEVYAVDELAMLQSTVNTYAFREQINTGSLTICEDLIEYVNIFVDGYPEPISWYQIDVLHSTDNSITFSSPNDSTQLAFRLHVPGKSTGLYHVEELTLVVKLPSGELAFAREVMVELTYFGDIGDVIKGTIAGDLHKEGAAGTLPFTGEFTVIRTE